MSKKIKKIKSAYNLKTKGKTKIYHFKYKGKMVLMCPKCFSTYIIEVDRKIYANYSIEKGNRIFPCSNFIGLCKKCGLYGEFIEIDGNIGKTIEILNKKGYYTKFCCEGHKKNKKEYTDLQSYIYFSNNLEYMNVIKEYLPKSWYIDYDDMRENRLSIRSKKDISLKQRIKDIQKMAKELPIKKS